MPSLTKYPHGVDAGVEIKADTLNIGGVAFGGIIVNSVTLSPAAVAPNTSAEQTFAVANLGTADVILSVNKPTAQAGLGIVGQRVSSAGTVGITFGNFTAGTITPTASQVYQIPVYRPAS